MMQSIVRNLLRLTAVAMLMAAVPTRAGDASAASGAETIVFVCRHGAVNSQMAAAYFNKIAKERGLPYTAVSRGIDTHRSVPVRIQDGLALDGLEPANTPDDLRPDEAARAFKVYAFDTIPAERRGSASVTYWPGVPLGINDYEATRDEIVRRGSMASFRPWRKLNERVMVICATAQVVSYRVVRHVYPTGKSCREIAKSWRTTCPPLLVERRRIQYPRDTSDWTEKPQRTGYPRMRGV